MNQQTTGGFALNAQGVIDISSGIAPGYPEQEPVNSGNNGRYTDPMDRRTVLTENIGTAVDPDYPGLDKD